MQSLPQSNVRRGARHDAQGRGGHNVGGTLLAVATLLIVCGGNPARAQAPKVAQSPGEALRKAATAEDWIQSGRLHILNTINTPRPDAERLKELKAGGKNSQLDLEIATTFPERINEDLTVNFDVKRKVILIEGTRDNETNRFKSRYSGDQFKTYTHSDLASREYKDEVHTQKPVWPPIWPYNLLTGSLWSGRLEAATSGGLKPTVISGTPTAGQTLYLAGGARAQLDQKLWFNPEQNHALSRLDFYDKKSKRLLEQVIITNVPQKNGAVYPQRIEDTYFSYLKSGKRYIARSEIITLENAEINVALPDSDLAFGDIPKNAFVQDHRFSRPLVYVQGDKQFTEQELFAALKDPSILNAPSARPTSQSSVARYPLVALGLALMAIAVAMWRRRKAATA